MNELLICAAGLGLSSLLGSVIGLVVRHIPHNWNDVFLGFCAGMMLTASIVCLIVPAVDMCSPVAWWQIVAGVATGVALIGILDRFMPHLHHLSGLKEDEMHKNNASLNRTLLFVMAIAIHKLPEGLATGISFNGDQGNAVAVAITIALQNIPEGMVVVTPLLMAGVRFRNTAMIAFSVAVLEVAGVFAGFFIGIIAVPSVHAFDSRRRDALRDKRRDDSRDPFARISETGHIRACRRCARNAFYRSVCIVVSCFRKGRSIKMQNAERISIRNLAHQVCLDSLGARYTQDAGT
jgi:ZIP family zinc transporter